MAVYRNDRDALQHLADNATRRADRLDAENAAIRQAMGNAVQPPLAMPMGGDVYRIDIRNLPLQERARLAAHQISSFPVWLVGVLNILTLGLFPLIHFGLLHDRLPRAAHNDPGAGRAIGFTFIPYYNFYWVFFNALRLADRLDLQFRLRGQRMRAPRGMLLAACIVSVIPYINFLIGIPVMWTIAVCLLQSRVNQVAALRPDDWDATPSPRVLAAQATGANVANNSPGYASPAVAQALVRWSHVLGWGGLGVLLVGTAVAGVATGAAGAVVVACVSGASIVVGAILGQVGRGKQGRAI